LAIFANPTQNSPLLFTLALYSSNSAKAEASPSMKASLPCEAMTISRNGERCLVLGWTVLATASPGARVLLAQQARPVLISRNREPEAGEPGYETEIDRGHPVGERPAADLERVPAGVPAGTPAGTNGHAPVRAPSSPAPDLRDVVDPAGHVPAPASGPGAGTEPGHKAGQSGHHGPVKTGRVP
jgi:hypothetical protein